MMGHNQLFIAPSTCQEDFCYKENHFSACIDLPHDVFCNGIPGWFIPSVTSLTNCALKLSGTLPKSILVMYRNININQTLYPGK